MSATVTVTPGHGTLDTFNVIGVRPHTLGERVTFEGPFEATWKPKTASIYSWSIATIASVASGDQWYYWTPAWQREEARAVTELRSGQYVEFNDAESAIAWLLGPDE